MKMRTHAVLEPLLRHLMTDEAIHARFYRRIAEAYLRGSSRARTAARTAMNRWWGTVGENFAGTQGADRAILYLFRDELGRDLAGKVDEQVASLPGLEGVRPMRRRLEQALRNARTAPA
jgi:1,2-phenylacetyl-CoA epoxidase catalytic subunit